MIQNLCEIVVWHIFVIFVILNSDSNETYRFTMRENNIGKYERSIFKWQVYRLRMFVKYILTVS